MPKVRARWKQKSPILRCPGCSRKLVVEFVGSYKVRAPSKAELAAAGVGIDAPDSVGTLSKSCEPNERGANSPTSVESTISYARARAIVDEMNRREDARIAALEEPPDDEGQSRGDGA